MERRKFFKQTGIGLMAAPLVSVSSCDKTTDVQTQKEKPKTTTYQANMRARSGIAMGGIGTGSIELRQDGNFYNWSIFNNYPLGAGSPFKIPNFPNAHDEDSLLFFLVKYQEEGKETKIKLLQINNSLNEAGMTGIAYYYPWMSAIESIQYEARFPFTTLTFEDSEMPFTIKMVAHSPFIPHDIKNSSLPGVYFDFEIIPTFNKKVKLTLLASLRNLVGYDTSEKYFVSRLNTGNQYLGFTHTVGGMDESSTSYGTMGLSSLSADTTYYLGWEHKHPYYEKLLVEERLPNVDDTENRNKPVPGTNRMRGHFTARDVKDQRCFSTLAKHFDLQSQNLKHTFLFSWHFPNAYGSHQSEPSAFDGDYIINEKQTKFIGHYYAKSFKSNEDLARYMIENESELNSKSRKFLDNFYDSSLETFVLDQVNSQFNTFISSSTLSKDGKFGIREGLTPTRPWGPNATMDVSLYGSVMILSLFPELQKNMMRAHKNLQTVEGEIAHGLAKDMDYTLNGTWGVYHRLDLVPNYIQQVLRDYFFTADQAYLEEMWPSIKMGMDYILRERDKNGDLLPEMEGVMCSYDNFPMYGHASYILSQWATAMLMVREVALEKKDLTLAERAEKIAERAISVMEEKLWNGKYFRLSTDEYGEKGTDEGCLTDQLVGQWTAHTSGLGGVFDRSKVNTALASIMEMSFTGTFLRNCTWPQYPDIFPIQDTNWWVDQANTPWTGVELAFASLLMYEDRFQDALAVIKGVDDRYRKAGLYWDHQEFGGHYYRPMAAWSIIHGALGFAKFKNTLIFDPKISKKTFKLLFAHPTGTAHFSRSSGSDIIKVNDGNIVFQEIKIKSKRENTDEIRCRVGKQDLKIKVVAENDWIKLSFDDLVTISANEPLTIFY